MFPSPVAAVVYLGLCFVCSSVDFLSAFFFVSFFLFQKKGVSMELFIF